MKASKGAPLKLKDKRNIVEVVATGGVYGTGVSEGGADNYAKNIVTSTAGNLLGYRGTKKLYGRGGAPIGREVLNSGANYLTTKTKNLLEDYE